MAAAASEGAVLVALKYLYPAIVFFYFLASSLLATCTLQALKKTQNAQPERPSRRAVICILGLFLSTYGAQLVILATQSIIERSTPLEHQVISYLSCTLVFGILCIQLVESDSIVWYPFRGSWFIALSFELAIAILTAVGSSRAVLTPYDMLHIMFQCLRLTSLVTLVAWTCLGLWTNSNPSVFDEETQPLLSADDDQAGAQTTSGKVANGSSYGSTTQSETDSDNTEEFNWERREREAREEMEKRLEEDGNWIEYAKGFMILFPYVWPMGNRSLQLRAAAVMLCLLASNALHLLIPRQTGIIMDTLGEPSGNPWTAVIIFALLRLVASESGIELIRQWLWIPVKYYSRDALSRASYSHVMNLSADFHDSKSSSDMLVAIQGGSAVSNAIESILLQAVPMLVDMCVAVIYLSIKFGPYEGLITVATGIVFITLATRLVAESKTSTRKRTNAWYQEHYIRSSGLTAWQTVSAFNQIGYEDNRHANAVTNRWLSEQQYIMGWHVSIAFQTIVLTAGLMASAFLAVFRIRSGQASPGQFAMLLMYWTQLTAPLQFFASLGKSMSDDFIDAERLLAVMKTKPSIENKKGARPLKFVRGEVQFDQVCFSYDKQKNIINEVSLHIPGGTTVAFVGTTGAGKSTLLKLLHRFYDVTSGGIRIDDQDVRDVDLYSLRDRVGIVPQNPVLFDDTIMNNVRYSKITASDEEVYEACKAASIHDKILTFTNGYETRVGERGIKLSGGELQRVAIARAILKQPDIVLLDEATSAVDTDTEQQIQASFKNLCQGRTTFIVAHRLSTVMNADRIVVVEHGKIIEEGSHVELVAKGGRYSDLWSKQTFVKPHDSVDSAKMLDDANTLANDSCSERTTTTEAYKPQNENNEPNAPQESDGKLVSGKMCQKEGSRLNPVAPEFTPRSMAAASIVPGPKKTSEAQPITGHPTKLRWSDEVSVMDERGMTSTPKSLSSESSRRFEAKDSSESSFTAASELRVSEVIPAVVVIQNPGVKPLQVGGKAKVNSVGPSGQPEPISETTAISANIDNVVFMRPRYSRRVQSKSEPVHKSSEPESVKCSGPSAKSTDDNAEQRRVSTPMAQSSNPAPSMIPKPGKRGSPAVRQLPIPPRNSSDGKCGTYPTPMPKDRSESAFGRVPTAAKDTSEMANVPITATTNIENFPPPKTGENQSIIATSNRGARSIRRLRTGSLRGRRGRASRGARAPNSQE
ncbi:hypothetical protein V8C35DRAFT_331176 [Trichoderma chlorosporum]